MMTVPPSVVVMLFVPFTATAGLPEVVANCAAANDAGGESMSVSLVSTLPRMTVVPSVAV